MGYNNIIDKHQKNQPLPQSTGKPIVSGARKRPTLPPIPQYQSLDPTAIASASYEPLDPQDINDSGLYERLDFRTMGLAHDYGTPVKDKEIPEYLELVSDTNVLPVVISLGKPEAGGYEPMGSHGVPDHVVKHQEPLPSYEPMDAASRDGTNLMESTPTSPKYNQNLGAKSQCASSPKYYEPMNSEKSKSPQALSEKYFESMAGNNLASSPEYYQPAGDVLSEESPSPREYYITIAENKLQDTVAQKVTDHLRGQTSKL